MEYRDSEVYREEQEEGPDEWFVIKGYTEDGGAIVEIDTSWPLYPVLEAIATVRRLTIPDLLLELLKAERERTALEDPLFEEFIQFRLAFGFREFNAP